MLYKLSKPRARTYITFEEDLDMSNDGWFISVKTFNKKDNRLKYKSCIIRKDIPTWLNYLKTLGWEEEHI